MNVRKIKFVSEDLPTETLAAVSLRDGVLLFVWNKSQVMAALAEQGLDALLEGASTLVDETLANSPPRLRSVS